MAAGKTSTGFEFDIDQERLENYELVEAIAEVEESGNGLAIPRMLKLLLGDQVQALKDHVRDENGLVSTKLLMEEVKDIFQNQQEVKK